MKADKSEQWKLNGDCSKCRRKNYCGTKCNKKSTWLQRLIGTTMADIVIKEASNK